MPTTSNLDRVNFYLPRELKAKLTTIAANKGIGIGELIRIWISEYPEGESVESRIMTLERRVKQLEKLTQKSK